MCNTSELVADINKLRFGLQAFKSLSLEEARRESTVADIIRQIGLSYDPRGVYGADNAYMNDTRHGLWQHPDQLAKALVELSYLEISRVLEIGTFKGWTTSVLAAYLRIFKEDLWLVTLDPVRHIERHPFWQELNIHFVQGRSDVIQGGSFDLCFIDGDHSEEAVTLDFEQLGLCSRVCLFHDINEELCPDVRFYWNKLRSRYRDTAQFKEFLDHSEGAQIMGIGLLQWKEWPPSNSGIRV